MLYLQLCSYTHYSLTVEWKGKDTQTKNIFTISFLHSLWLSWCDARSARERCWLAHWGILHLAWDVLGHTKSFFWQRAAVVLWVLKHSHRYEQGTLYIAAIIYIRLKRKRRNVHRIFSQNNVFLDKKASQSSVHWLHFFVRQRLSSVRMKVRFKNIKLWRNKSE